ncbi:hypothetical protein IQ268_08425 [Oculatella sp. LEGE 06141]|uniref:hypothetical protein n=1 Tax=Oculatella sp. LEGE 06141 TaxID=1828648 RepID=UPI00187E73B1|nr:hypothetical protein [Oculatella sp. LEGE 06141]MBE9178582.1 hypothetical protein [Oculatella sp. LEGE 06141]
MTFELTEEDFSLLRRSRQLRLHTELQLHPSTFLYLDSAYQMHICCIESSQACNLLQRKSEVRDLVWLITGCEQVTLWLNQERVWAEATREILPRLSSEELESIATAIIEDIGMGTAILEKPAAQTASTQVLAINENFVPIDQLAEQISSITGQPTAIIIKQILAAKPEMDFDGTTYTVAPNAGDTVIDYWAAELKAKIRSLPAPVVPVTEAKQNGAATGITINEPDAVEVEEESKSSALKLPSGFGKSVSNRYQPTLSKLLPKDEEQQSFYIVQITSETDAGKDFLSRIAKAIAKKYNNKPDEKRAYEGLLKVAKTMRQATAA